MAGLLLLANVGVSSNAMCWARSWVGDYSGEHMLSRAARTAFIFVQFVVLNMILPGHTRGLITLPGYTPSHRGQIESCCSRSQSSDSPNAPTPLDRAHCAICFFAARICPPIAHDFGLTKLWLTEVQPAPAAIIAASIEFSPTYLSRGPPA